MKYYSNSTGGFYDPEINKVIPQDAIEISDDLHMTLLAGQAEGKIIVCNGDIPALGYPQISDEEMFFALRASRDVRLAATDKYMLADYPISEDNLVLVKEYRAALRDLPEQPGAPWDGGGDETPWPLPPEF